MYTVSKGPSQIVAKTRRGKVSSILFSLITYSTCWESLLQRFELFCRKVCNAKVTIPAPPLRCGHVPDKDRDPDRVTQIIIIFASTG